MFTLLQRAAHERDTTPPYDLAMTSPLRTPYLVSWRLAGRRVVVVGGGSIGEGKVETLLGTGADLVVIDPSPSDRVLDLAAADRLRVVTRGIRPHDVWRASLVVAATGDAATNRRIRRWAKLAGALVNAVDDPDACDITIPAVIHRGGATIAISTDGASPAAARFVREQLEELPEDIGLLVDRAGEARAELRATGRYRYDYTAWRQLLLEPGLTALRSGRAHVLDELRDRFVAEFPGSKTPIRTGSVTLVGAGPGGADLITVRGARALAAADVVLYDRLADPELLDLAPIAAQRIPVGKGKGFGMAQDEICRLIVEHGLAGRRVVRLKGGDPFVFGRGSEEVDAAVAAGLPVDVVPGLSASLAGPALAGIPVTDRREAAGFTVISGHRASDHDYDWDALSRTKTTLVVMMAASTADAVARRLLQVGRSEDEDVAFVHRAGTAGQQVEHLTLAAVAATGCPLPAPTVMVIGSVARRALVASPAVVPTDLRVPVV